VSGVTQINTFGQQVGAPLPPGWTAPAVPGFQRLSGRYAALERLSAAQHAEGLYSSGDMGASSSSWTYLPYGPFGTFEEYRIWAQEAGAQSDPQFFAILSRDSGLPMGVCSYLRIDPAAGSIEVGHIWMSARLQRTVMATEAMYLMMREAFALGYRRFEWKCDALNAPSQRAAARLGFTFEGTFRQATHYKGRNRDTAWYSITDGEWPACRAALEGWLAPSNFDARGRQLQRLETIRAEAARNKDKEK
jgi:RimJ/RimL family protein N-acetyltransferase